MASSRSRKLWVFLVVIVVLAGLLVAADRIALVVAEKAAADKLRTSQGLTSTPDVSVAGFPFLDQLVEESFDKITVVADDVPVADGRLDLSKVTIVLHKVTASDNFNTVHTARADATTHVDYAALSKALGTTVSYAGHGTVRATPSVTVLGRTFTGTVTTTPKLVDGALSFASGTVSGLSSAAAAVSEAVAKVFDLSLPLDGVPFKVTADDLVVNASGLSLTLTGSNLTYTK